MADQEDAYYNLGNTLYRSGQKTEQSSADETLKTWDQAVKAYDTALQLRAGAALHHTKQEVLHVVELLDRAQS